MGKAIAFATPVFFLLIALELFVARARGMGGAYRLNDAINSLSLGVMSQVVGLFVRVFNYRHLCARLRARGTRHLAARVVGLAAGHRLLRLLLLLEPPARARKRGVLGVARGASPEPVLQPVDGPAADQQRRVARLDLLPADGSRRRAARDVRGRGDRRPALPVLDPHRTRRQARLVRPLVRLAVEPSGAPRRQRPLHRPQLRRHLHGLGPALRHVRRGVRTLRLRHARTAQFVGPAVGQPRGLRRPRAQVAGMRALGRQAAGLAEAAGLAAGAPTARPGTSRPSTSRRCARTTRRCHAACARLRRAAHPRDPRLRCRCLVRRHSATRRLPPGTVAVIAVLWLPAPSCRGASGCAGCVAAS